MWAIILVSGQLYVNQLTGQTYFNSQAACVNTAAVVQGRCVQLPTQPPASLDPAMRYLDCAAVRACRQE